MSHDELDDITFEIIKSAKKPISVFNIEKKL